MQITDITTINKQVQSSLPVLKTIGQAVGENNNEFAMIDRIANLLDKATGFINTYQKARGTPEIERQPPSNFIDSPPNPNQIQNSEVKETTQMKIIKFLLPIVEAYLDKCIKDNPKMTIGEAITKLDIINVSETKELLKSIRG